MAKSALTAFVFFAALLCPLDRAEAVAVLYINGDGAFCYGTCYTQMSFYDGSGNPISPSDYFDRVITPSANNNVSQPQITVFGDSGGGPLPLFSVMFSGFLKWDPFVDYSITLTNLGADDLLWNVNLGIDPLPPGTYDTGTASLGVTTTGGDVTFAHLALGFLSGTLGNVYQNLDSPCTPGTPCSAAGTWALTPGAYDALHTTLDVTLAPGATATVRYRGEIYQSVPEPASIGLLGAGLAVATILRRRLAR
jgi:hypothetical protein